MADGLWFYPHCDLCCVVVLLCYAAQMYQYRAEAIAREKASQQGFRVTLEA
jgi:hypothetical protein